MGNSTGPNPTDRAKGGVKRRPRCEGRGLAGEFGDTAHIRARGEEARKIQNEVGFKARRWVVERTHGWMNRFRRTLTRWEKTRENSLGFLHLACALITVRTAGLLR